MKLSYTVLIYCTAVLFFSCSEINKKDGSPKNLNSDINYSESNITPADIQAFYKKFDLDSSIKKQLNQFYAGRDYQMAWFVAGEKTTTAGNFYEKLMEHAYVLQDSTVMYKQLIKAWNAPPVFKNKTENANDVNLEILLTACFFKYSQTAQSGTITDLKSLEWYIPRKKKNYVAMLDSIVEGKMSDDGLAVNPYYGLLKNYLAAYREIEQNGGWPKISREVIGLKQGQEATAAGTLKKYLLITGDMQGEDTTSVYDSFLFNAVTSFQNRMGIDKTGFVDELTYKQLNIPVTTRIKQIMINMERMRWFTAPDSTMDFFVVNIPAYKLFVFEKGKLKWDMNVVVGTTANRTTVFKGDMSQVVINPYWHVPESIISNEMLEKFQGDADSYAASQQLEVISEGSEVQASNIDWNNPEAVEKISIRQKPGEHNSLGRYKFLFPNSFSIYLHDTPAKHLFSKNVRSFSHGCIRVAEPEKLAKYILRNDPKFTDAALKEILLSGKEKSIPVKPALPVYLVYFTTWVHDDLKLHFRDDIYENDKRLEMELFEEEKMLSGN